MFCLMMRVLDSYNIGYLMLFLHINSFVVNLRGLRSAMKIEKMRSAIKTVKLEKHDEDIK